MAGKAGEPGRCPRSSATARTTASSSIRGTSGGKTKTPPSSPTWSIAARSTNCLKDVEPRGKSPEASLEVDPRARPGFKVELAAARAAGEGPDRLRLGGRRQALGRRDGRLSARQSTARASRAASSGSWKTPTATAVYDKATTFLDGLAVSHRRDALAERGARRLRSRHLLCRGPRRRRQGRPSRGPLHRVRRGEPAAPAQRLRAGPRRLGLRRQRRQRRHDPLAQDAARSCASAAATSGSGPTRASSRPRAARRSTAGTATTGATGSATTTRTGPGTTSSPTPTSAATRTTPPPDPQTDRSSPTPGSIPISRTLPRFNDPGAANHVTSANSPTPYRDDLFGPEFATSLFVSEPVHNLVHRMVLEPARGDLPRPSRARTRPSREFLASSDNWFRPTHAQDGPRRRALDGRHVPRGHRAPRVDSRRLGSEARPPRRQRAGADLSRLSRRSASRGRSPGWTGLDTAGLVAALDSPSGWQRDTAQRLLLHRRDPGAIAPLRALAAATAAAQDAASRRSGRWPIWAASTSVRAGRA